MSGFTGFIGSEVESVDGTYCFDFSRAFAEAVESGNENNLPVVVIAALQGMCLVAGFYSFFFRTFKYHSASPFSDWLETTNPSTCSSEAASQEQVFEHAAISDS